MQTLRLAVVPLLLFVLCACFSPAAQAVVRLHTVTLGPARRVVYTPPEATPGDKSQVSSTLLVRTLNVDGQQREWTVGPIHDVTDRSFVIQRMLRMNDSLPSERPHWTWQPGPWLMVDRMTGHIAVLHLPAFDAEVSEVRWFRDYAAYCGIATTVRNGGLVAVVAELGARKAVVQKVLGPWPEFNGPHQVCATPQWQRTPMRATLQKTGDAAITFDVVGTSSLIEEGETSDE